MEIWSLSIAFNGLWINSKQAAAMCCSLQFPGSCPCLLAREHHPAERVMPAAAPHNLTPAAEATAAAPARGSAMFVAQVGLRGMEKSPSKAKASSSICHGYNISSLCSARGSQRPSQEVVPCFGCTAFLQGITESHGIGLAGRDHSDHTGHLVKPPCSAGSS